MDAHRRFRRFVLLVALLAPITTVGVLLFNKVAVTICSATTGYNRTVIFLALEGYRDANGHYPPQYLVDDQGKPAHSWRVLLLPYMGRGDLYSRYRFDEPWNGPHNRLLAREMPEEFRSPFADPTSTKTPYVGIAGKHTPWCGTRPFDRRDLKRPRDSVVWFVEAANSGIDWMEPRDIPLEQALHGGLKSNYSYGLPAQMLFRECKWVPIDIAPEALREMLTINDEDMELSEKSIADHDRSPSWGHESKPKTEEK